MDFSTQSSIFGASTYGASTFGTTTTSQPDKNKEQRFHSWHQKQGISAPQDYTSFASQPAPFSALPQNPNHPTAASPYLRKMAMQQSLNGGVGDDTFTADSDGRRKSGKRTASSPPSPAGKWPKDMFGTRPPSRTRARTSSTPDPTVPALTENFPPMKSIYDSYAGTSAAPASTSPPQQQENPAMTPTQVRVANFSEDRFPDLIRALRRYYGVILEPYSGLPQNESQFLDPEVVPRETLDRATARMVQPMSGADGGPGPWVRITFRDRESAERAVEGAEKGELVVGGRRILVTFWEQQEERLPFAMDIDQKPALVQRRDSVHAPVTPRRTSFSARRQSMTAEDDGETSAFMPGAKIVVPKPVEFAKKEGWWGQWTPAAATSAASKKASESGGWGSSIVGGYRYIMDEVVGFKYL